MLADFVNLFFRLLSWISGHVAVVVSVVSLLLNGLLGFLVIRNSWELKAIAAQQTRIATEKLRHDLFEKRYAVYAAFVELLVHVGEGGANDAAKPRERLRELRVAASTAFSQSRFLFNKAIQSHLGELYKEAFRIEQMRANPELADHLEGAEKAAYLKKQLEDQVSLFTVPDRLADMLEHYLQLNDLSNPNQPK